MFSPVEKSLEARGNEHDQVWGRTASSLMWSLPLPEHKKKPLLPPSQSLLLFLFLFLPDLRDAWQFCCFVSGWGGMGGHRNASRWKEKRVLVGTAALDFKPYKISNAPQSQTSNRQQVVERSRAGWSWPERISSSVLQARRLRCAFTPLRLLRLKTVERSAGGGGSLRGNREDM